MSISSSVSNGLHVAISYHFQLIDHIEQKDETINELAGNIYLII